MNNNPLKIIETTYELEDMSLSIINRLEIINSSQRYMNNVKLTISNNSSIINQRIIRERGELTVDSTIHLLELGNLAPNETAYFEYTMLPESNTFPAKPKLLVSYTPEDSKIETSLAIPSILIQDENS